MLEIKLRIKCSKCNRTCGQNSKGFQYKTKRKLLKLQKNSEIFESEKFVSEFENKKLNYKK